MSVQWAAGKRRGLVMADQNDKQTPDFDDLVEATNQIMSMLDPEGAREYDLHNKLFEQLVDFLGELAAATVPSHIKPQFDPMELLQFYTELFTKPEILHTKFPDDVDRIFSLIGGVFYSYEVPALIENPKLPLQLREDCVRTLYYLYERLLTNHNIVSMYWFWSRLCNVRVGRQNNSQKTDDYTSEDQRIREIVFETLTQILNIDSPYCQHTALRALYDLQHPQTKPVIDAYLLSHPDLTTRERKYALATTQEVLYDISDASFDEFLEYIFDHPSYERLWEFDPVSYSPVRSTQFYIQLFNEPAFLFQRFRREQLEQGFWAIQSCNLEIAAGKIAATKDILLNLRLDFIRAVYNLYKNFFAIDCLDTSAHMWWDCMISEYERNSKLTSEEDVAIRDAMFETLVRILEIDSPACKGAALHGLGHLMHPRKEALIHGFLEKQPELDDKTRGYALACITGNIM